MAQSPKVKNSEKFKINNQYFTGGQALDYKMGVSNSFFGSRNLDFRTFPSQMSVLPQSRSLSTNASDLITAMDQDLNGVRWGIGDSGFLYRIGTDNTVSVAGDIGEDGSAGLLYCQITDQLYIPGQDTVAMYGRVTQGTSSEPVIRTKQFAQSASLANGCAVLYNPNDGLFDSPIVRNNVQIVGLSQGVTNFNQVLINPAFTQKYFLPRTIIETPTNFCFFAPDIEPGFSIAIAVPNDTAFTGVNSTWTLTLHDSLNNVLGQQSAGFADMQKSSLITGGSGWHEFVFPQPVRVLVNASNTGTSPTYHFHLTSTADNGGGATTGAYINCYTANDLSTCSFLWVANRLVQTNNGWHPTAYFTGTGQPLLCVGNGEYLSTYNFGNDANPSNGSWQRHALTFRPGDEVCGLSVNNQYLVIATERRSNDITRNAQLGTLYFWDGTTAQPNFLITLPMGSPYGLYTFNNITYFECAGSLYAWSGGQTVLKVRKFVTENTDFLGASDDTIVYPNGFTSRYNILCMGYPGHTSNPRLDSGIWTWGTPELTYPNSFGYSYGQSHGLLDTSQSQSLSVGVAENFVDSLYSSWRKGSGNLVTNTYTVSSGPLFVGNDASNGSTQMWLNAPGIIGNIGGDTGGASSGPNNVTTLTQYLQANNFSFSVPAGATILGVTATVREQASQNSSNGFMTDNGIRLYKKDGTFSTNNKATATHWSTSNTTVTYGGVSDTWGDVLTPDDINSPNFGLALSSSLTNTVFNSTATVRWVQLSVTYSVQEEANIQYGLDVVDNFSTPAKTFHWESLIFDGGAVYKEKMAVRHKVYFEPLPAGCTLTPYYTIDRNQTITGPTATEGDTEVFIEQNNARFHELQWGFDGTCDDTAAAPPVILGITEEIDGLPQEVDLLPGER